MVATLTPNQCQTAPRDSRQHATLADSSKKNKKQKTPKPNKKIARNIFLLWFQSPNIECKDNL